MLWNRLLPNDILRLERAHRLCIKYIQDIPLRTKTDIALNAIGCLSLESEIDKNKLRFFGQLCTVQCHKRFRSVFANRLTAYLTNPSTVEGFIPDIVRILHKYSLFPFLESFLQTGRFVVKCRWKELVRTGIVDFERRSIHSRLGEGDPLTDLVNTDDPLTPCILWQVSALNGHILRQCQSAVVLMCKMFSETYRQYCPRCCVITENRVIHCMFECIYSDNERNVFWRIIIHHYGLEMFSALITMSPMNQACVLFGYLPDTLSTHTDAASMVMLSIRFLHRIKLMFNL